MRVRETPRGIPGNSIGKWDSTTRPIKDSRTSQMANNLEIGQRSPKHTRGPRIPTGVHPRFLPYCKTTHGALAEKQNLRMDRTVHGGSKRAHPTSHHAAGPNSPRPQ